MDCGCKSAGECAHFILKQWEEMSAASRQIVYARRRAMEELLRVVLWHIEKGSPLPSEIAEAVERVGDATCRVRAESPETKG